MTESAPPRGAWHGDQNLKDRILDLLRDDQANDRYIQGSYLTSHGAADDNHFRGCHIGCLMMAKIRLDRPHDPEMRHVTVNTIAGLSGVKASSWAAEMPDELGMPETVGDMWDSMFEKMPYDYAPEFAVKSLEAVPPGADLTQIPIRLILWMINDPQYGAAHDPRLTEGIRAAVPALTALYEQILASHWPSSDQWWELRHTMDKIQGPFYNHCEAALMCASRGVGRTQTGVSFILNDMLDNMASAGPDYMMTIAEQLYQLCGQAPIVVDTAA